MHAYWLELILLHTVNMLKLTELLSNFSSHPMKSVHMSTDEGFPRKKNNCSSFLGIQTFILQNSSVTKTQLKVILLQRVQRNAGKGHFAPWLLHRPEQMIWVVFFYLNDSRIHIPTPGCRGAREALGLHIFPSNTLGFIFWPQHIFFS